MVNGLQRVVLAGSGNLALAGGIAAALGAPLAGREIEVFPDGELHVGMRQNWDDGYCRQVPRAA